MYDGISMARFNRESRENEFCRRCGGHGRRDESIRLVPCEYLILNEITGSAESNDK